MDNFQEITVSFTSRFMAAMRFLESRQPNPLFVDYFAEKLAGQDVIEQALGKDEQKV